MTVGIEARGSVLVLTMDRPETRNALDDALVAALTDAYRSAARDEMVRAVVLAAAGPAFSAGADLAWMQRMAAASEEENLADARRLAALMHVVDTCPKPTVARIQGSAFGGALGLIACSDIAVATIDADFAVTEVRLGLIPAVISPYLVRAIGARAARRLSVAAERFSADEAKRLGLIHEVVPHDQLDTEVDRQVAALLAGAPGAIAAAKALVADIGAPIDAELIDETARRIAARRKSAEGQEGLAAFLEKRKPRWAP